MSSSFQDNKNCDLDYRLFENPNQKCKSTWTEKLIYCLNVAGSFINRHIDKIRLCFVILWILISFVLNWKSVLNVAFSIPLIIQRIPIKFDVEIEEIYAKWFSGYMSKGDFKKLNETRIKRRSHPGTKIVTEGNPFESLYLFTRIPNDAKVIISCQNKKISSVREGSWVCVPEMLQAQEKYIEYENKRKKIDKTKDVQRQLNELRK